MINIHQSHSKYRKRHFSFVKDKLDTTLISRSCTVLELDQILTADLEDRSIKNRDVSKWKTTYEIAVSECEREICDQLNSCVNNCAVDLYLTKWTNKMDKKSITKFLSQKCLKNGQNSQCKLDESGEDSGTCSDSEQRSSVKEDEITSDFSETELELTCVNPDSFLRFHLTENKGGMSEKKPEFQDIDIETFAGRKYVGIDCSTIKSSKGSIRGVKNRVRAGIATFLEMKDSKTWQEREAGKVVVYTTTMGVIRETFQRCLKVRHILRTHLIKYTEKDVFMSREIQNEIKERMGVTAVQLPQVFVEGIYLGDADTIEKLNETGELRKVLKPYKNSEVCTTCSVCGGYQLLPCSLCNGSKKSVHRNHFNSELIALKCMNCDEVGLVRCYAC